MSALPHSQPSKPVPSNDNMADMLCTIMILCRGTDENGNAVWAYMAIKPSMARSFKEARDRGIFDLEDYGTIIESGEGENPPEEVKRRMERNYGMNHSYEDSLLAALDRMKYQDKF